MGAPPGAGTGPGPLVGSLFSWAPGPESPADQQAALTPHQPWTRGLRDWAVSAPSSQAAQAWCFLVAPHMDRDPRPAQSLQPVLTALGCMCSGSASLVPVPPATPSQPHARGQRGSFRQDSLCLSYS